MGWEFMIKTLRAIGLAGLLLTVAGPAAAQWPAYPSRNVPRTPDGEVDMDAPPPRTIDGHIDFTGIWAAGGGGGGARGRGRGRGGGTNGAGPDADGGRNGGPAGRTESGAVGRNGGGPAGGDGGGNDETQDTPPLATFFDIGANIEGGAPYSDWGRQVKEERMARDSQDNPDAHCLPMGHMQFHLHPQPRKMIQTEDEIVILYEGNAGIRQIFLDGRPSPDNNPLPWWYGYSTGHWEGDELVVTTTHMKDDGWLDVNGSPFTSEGTITERFRRPTFGRLEIDVTIDDPKAYTRPFTVRVNQRIMVDTNLIEFVCIENEQSSAYYD
jgi:hypothetical protein